MKRKNNMPDYAYLSTIHKHNKPKNFIITPRLGSLIGSNLTVKNFRPVNFKDIIDMI